MKSKENLLEQLKSLPYFSKDSLYQLGKQVGLADASVDTYISRFLKRKEILPFKRGLYVSADFLAKNRGNASYSFYLANILRAPSYISSWSALQFYNLTTEMIYGVTSVTTKLTRNYTTKAGNFTYQTINRRLFADFALMRSGPLNEESKQFDFFIASPAKALFDLLYFKTRQFRGVRVKDVGMIAEELRVDVEEMDQKEQSRFAAMIREYLNDE